MDRVDHNGASTDARSSTPASRDASANLSAPNPSSPDPDPAPAAAPGDVLLLEVILNGHPIGKIGEFELRRGMLYARPEELRALGFRVSNVRRTRDGLVALNDLTGLVWEIDVAKQQVLVTAVDAALIATAIQPTPVDAMERQRKIESGTGMTLNYDTTGSFSSNAQGGSAALDLRAFSPRGITSSDWQINAGSQLSGSGVKPVVRLDSAYTFADVRTLRRYSLGDFINSTLSWQRPVHMEGVQWRSDFTMRPDLITFPLPSIGGSAAVPSTVDVLVNGNLVSSTQVEPGPFEVQQLPVISGAGTVTMTMTNSLGQQVTISQPFYGGASLLASGLHSYSVQAGLVRRNWGTASNDYGTMAAAGYYRRGLSTKLTIEAAGEATKNGGFASAGAAALLGSVALVNLDLAAGSGTDGPGSLASGGVQHIGRIFNWGGSATLTTRNFRDIASLNGSGKLRHQLSGFGGVALPRVGSLAVAYAALSQDAVDQTANVLNSAQHSRVITANYSVQIRRLSLYATEFHSFDAGSSSGFQAGIIVPFGHRSSASVSGSSDGSMQVLAQQTPVRIGDWGYEAYASAGNTTHTFAEAQYKSAAGLLTAGIDSTDGKSTFRIETQGAVSLVDGTLFPSNTVYDSFAIVDTAPVGHVRVYQENRDVGVTSRSGRLLVPDMRAFDVNHIGIDPRDIPPDTSFALDKRIVRPQDRSGVILRFAPHITHSALLRLVDPAGKPVALGSTATLRATGAVVPVGYDGEAYVEDLAPHNRVIVLREGHPACTADFDYPASPGDIPTIGPVRCLEVQP